MVWRRPAENVANFLKKGSLAGVDGRVQTRSYDGQDGKRVYVTEILAESVQFLEPKGQGQTSADRGDNNYSRQNDQGSPFGGNQNQRSNNQGYTKVDEDPFAGSGQIDISDDDLPF